MPSYTRFLDLEEAVELWGWKMFEANARGKKAKQLLDRKNRKQEPCIGLEIDWSRVEFTHHTTWASLADAELESDASTSKTRGNNNQAAGLKVADITAADVNVLFQTKFTNDTDREQTYSLRIEKTTRSTCDTVLENSVTKGMEMSVKLALPGEVFEANAGFSREVALTRTEGESIEEELVWNAESTIAVPKAKVANAMMLVIEKKQQGEFSVLTTVNGAIMLSFTNRLDNNSLLFTQSGKIDHVIKEYINDMKKVNKNYPFVNIDNGEVKVTTKGSCRFRYGIKQEVKVVTHDIEKS